MGGIRQAIYGGRVTLDQALQAVTPESEQQSGSAEVSVQAAASAQVQPVCALQGADRPFQLARVWAVSVVTVGWTHRD